MTPSQQLRTWAHELAAMARTGLEFSPTPYDTDRYERIARIAEGIAGLTIDAEFTPERPYLPDVGIATPKVGCTFAAFDAEGRVLLIRRSDNGRWALPGGWAEVGTPPAENAVREVREETGCEVIAERLIGVYDSRRFGHTSPYHFWSCCFRGRVIGGSPTLSTETLDVAFVTQDELPSEMSEMQRRMVADAFSASREAVYQ